MSKRKYTRITPKPDIIKINTCVTLPKRYEELIMIYMENNGYTKMSELFRDGLRLLLKESGLE